MQRNRRGDQSRRSRVNLRKQWKTFDPDKWLNRMASLSQPALFILAFWGYYYTVKPVFQKELLSEQVAAKEIELAASTREVDRLKQDSQVLREKVDQASTELYRTGLLIYHDNFLRTVEGLLGEKRLSCAIFLQSPTLEALARSTPSPYALVSNAIASKATELAPGVSALPVAVRKTYVKMLEAELERNRTALSIEHPEKLVAMKLLVERAGNNTQSKIAPGRSCSDRQLGALYENDRIVSLSLLNSVRKQLLQASLPNRE